MKLGVSYRRIGPRGGKGKPKVYFQINHNIPSAKISQMEAYWRAQEKYQRCEVWMWED